MPLAYCETCALPTLIKKCKKSKVPFEFPFKVQDQDLKCGYCFEKVSYFCIFCSKSVEKECIETHLWNCHPVEESLQNINKNHPLRYSFLQFYFKPLGEEDFPKTARPIIRSRVNSYFLPTQDHVFLKVWFL